MALQKVMRKLLIMTNNITKIINLFNHTNTIVENFNHNTKLSQLNLKHTTNTKGAIQEHHLTLVEVMEVDLQEVAAEMGLHVMLYILSSSSINLHVIWIRSKVII